MNLKSVLITIGLGIVGAALYSIFKPTLQKIPVIGSYLQ
jgi:hypothetical protein